MKLIQFNSFQLGYMVRLIGVLPNWGQAIYILIECASTGRVQSRKCTMYSMESHFRTKNILHIHLWFIITARLEARAHAEHTTTDRLIGQSIHSLYVQSLHPMVEGQEPEQLQAEMIKDALVIAFTRLMQCQMTNRLVFLMQKGKCIGSVLTNTNWEDIEQCEVGSSRQTDKCRREITVCRVSSVGTVSERVSMLCHL